MTVTHDLQTGQFVDANGAATHFTGWDRSAGAVSPGRAPESPDGLTGDARCRPWPSRCMSWLRTSSGSG